MNTRKMSQKWLNDEEIIKKWFKYCKERGIDTPYPSNTLERDRKYAYLTNCNGVIARFNLRNHRFEIGNEE